MLRAAVLRPLLRTARATRTFAAIPAEGSSVACGVLKNQKDPVIRPDGDYPEWLGSLTDTLSLADLENKIVAAGGHEKCDPQDLRRYMQKRAKENIKDKNDDPTL